MNCFHRIFRSAPLLCAAVFVFGTAHATGQEFIALDNWSYDAVERLETLGLCVLPEDKPYTRTEFMAIVAEISKSGWDKRLGPRDRYNLARLEKEYTEFSSLRDSQYRYDPPTLYLKDDPMVFEGDIDLNPYVAQEFLSDETEVFVNSNPLFRIHVGENVTFDARYRLTFGPEHGDRARDEKPSRREKSFKGLTSLYERGYFIAGWDKFHVLAGREYVEWGPSDWGNLITPGYRHSVDQIGYRFRVGFLRLSHFNGQLSPDSSRFFAGHRFEMKFKKTVIGFTETVVYSGKDFDWTYAFPLSSFYANQFNERDNKDNIYWGVDAKTVLFNRLTVYGSLLIDDAQFERDGDYPDKLAFDVGGRYAMVRPFEMTMRARYRYVDIYTLTHKEPLSAYVSGEADLSEGDVLLGGDPGPDTASWRVEGEFYPRANIIATVSAFGERRGEGNDFRGFQFGDDITPPFPLGVVQNTRGVGLDLRYELPRNMWVEGSYHWATIDNLGNVSGVDETTDAFRVFLRWQFL